MSATSPSAPRSAPRAGPLRRVQPLRRTWQRLPRAAWLCALVAALNCAAWSLITPPFQVPDESSHYAYVEQLATHARPPLPLEAVRPVLSSSEQAALDGLGTEAMRFHAESRSLLTRAEADALAAQLRARPSRGDGNGVSLAGSPQPPLYYALELPAYALGAGGSPLTSVALMRIVSALLGGVTALLAFLFLREALPAYPWAWSVGALGVAFQPLFAFMSGGVNPDALLFAVASALFLCLARGFRRGLDARLAVATGAVIAAGFLTKLNFLGLVPGALAGLVVLGVRAEGRTLRALRLPALALGVALAPIALELLANVALWERPAIGAASGAFRPASGGLSLGGVLAYDLQFYVAHLPGTRQRTSDAFALEHVWIRGFVGDFGWVDTAFRGWVYGIATAVLGLIGALALAALARGRAALRARRAELLVYAAMAAGLLALVGLDSYNLALQHAGGAAQARYLLPLLPLYAALLALAARGAGRRWAPVAGTAIVLLALAHDVFSQLLVIARYYS